MFAEASGTFLLVPVAAAGGVVAAMSGGRVTLGPSKLALQKRCIFPDPLNQIREQGRTEITPLHARLKRQHHISIFCENKRRFQIREQGRAETAPLHARPKRQHRISIFYANECLF